MVGSRLAMLVLITLAGIRLMRSPSGPPYSGTIFINSDIIRHSDPSDLQTIHSAGTGQRQMFDRRADCFLPLRPYLFNARYVDGLQIEIQVNPEFTAAEAREVAEKYAHAYGQLPKALRADVQTSWIHKGVYPFGGGNKNILVHTGQGAEYEREGILQEALFHEAVHTSLDSGHENTEAWRQAQTADRRFISKYAQENPNREDLAETMLLWFAVRHRRDRMPADLISTVEKAIPARLRYLDQLKPDFSGWPR